MNNFTKEQKELLERLKEEILLDRCIRKPRVSQMATQQLVMCYSRFIRIKEYAPQILINKEFELIKKRLVPYDDWRKRNIITEGPGFEIENLSENQQAIIKKVNDLIDRIIEQSNCDDEKLTEADDIVLSSMADINFYKGLPYRYSNTFIKSLIDDINEAYLLHTIFA